MNKTKIPTSGHVYARIGDTSAENEWFELDDEMYSGQSGRCMECDARTSVYDTKFINIHTGEVVEDSSRPCSANCSYNRPSSFVAGRWAMLQGGKLQYVKAWNE